MIPLCCPIQAVVYDAPESFVALFHEEKKSFIWRTTGANLANL